MSSYDAPLASLSLTHVYYDPKDPLSLLSAFLSLTPQALMVIYATLLLSTHELEIALMFAGQLLSEAANWVLKRAIKESRPPHLPALIARMRNPNSGSPPSPGASSHHEHGYGMPSSHAQFVAFWAAYLALFLVVRHRARADTRSPSPLAVRVVLAVLGGLGAVAVAASRVYLGYHTTKQVGVGAVFGVGFGIAWFVAVGWLRRSGWTDWALELPIARWARVRDLVVNEDLADSGWIRWEEIRASDRKTNVKKTA